MPARKPATEVVEETESTGEDDSRSATVGDVKKIVSEVVGELKSVFGGETTDEQVPEVPGDKLSDDDKLPSPRRIEIDTEKSVRDALSGLTINVHNNGGASEEKPKKEPEEVPGGKSLLSRIVGLS